MTPTLLLYFLENDTHCYLIMDDNGQISTPLTFANLKEIASLTLGKKIIVFIPNRHVLVTQVSLPKMNMSKLKIAIPFALEDKLAEDIDNLHFALGSVTWSQPIPVAIVNKSKLQTWLEQLQEAAISPHILTSDLFALPYFTNSITIVIDKPMALVRTHPYQGFTIETDNLNVFLEQELQEKTKIYIYQLQKNEKTLIETIQKQFPELEIEIISIANRYELATKCELSDTINLLQNEFSISHKISSTKKAWNFAVFAIIAWLIISVLTHISHYVYLSHKNRQLNTKIAALYMEIFPKATAMISPKLRIQRELEKYGHLETDSGFLAALAKTGHVLIKFPDIKLLSLAYSNKQLRITVRASNFQILQQLASDFSDENINFTQTDATTDNDTVKAEYRITV